MTGIVILADGKDKAIACHWEKCALLYFERISEQGPVR